MTLSVLSCVTKALGKVGVTAPGTLVSSDPMAIQLLEIANVTGRELARMAEWERLTNEYTFTSVATTNQLALFTTLPSLRKIVDNTMYNRTRQQRIIGPITSQAWQNILSTSINPATLYWRLRNGNIMFPGSPPTAGHTIAFEWVTKFWCGASTDTSPTQEDFAADTDIPFLPDELFVLGIRWRFLQAKGLEYGEDFRMYQDKLTEAIGNDQPAETLNLNVRQNWDLPSGYVPDGFWNL